MMMWGKVKVIWLFYFLYKRERERKRKFMCLQSWRKPLTTLLINLVSLIHKKKKVKRERKRMRKKARQRRKWGCCYFVAEWGDLVVWRCWLDGRMTVGVKWSFFLYKKRIYLSMTIQKENHVLLQNSSFFSTPFYVAFSHIQNISSIY